jgi:hypothetical protein
MLITLVCIGRTYDSVFETWSGIWNQEF